MKRIIVAPLSLEQDNSNILKYVEKYARLSSSEVLFMTIVEKTNLFDKIFGQSSINSTIRAAVEQNVKKIIEDNFPSDIKYKTLVSEGKAYEEIEKVVWNHNPLAVVVGKNEKKQTNTLGSNTMHIITEVSNPVLTINCNYQPNTENNILVPLDITKNYNEQLSAAYEMSRYFNAKLFVFSIDSGEDIAHSSRLLVKMNKIRNYFSQNNTPIHTEIIKGTKAEIVTIINQKVEQYNPLFTIIMLREESNKNKYYLGTVAQQILNKIDSPIMSIQPFEQKQDQEAIFEFIINPFDIF